MRQSTASRQRRGTRSLDAKGLEALALRYVGRYATSRAKLRDYLLRKIGEADWAGEAAPDPDALVARIAELGYVDDRAFAEQRAAALGRRGYGARRIGMAFRAAGIEAEDGEEALASAREGALDAALALARRRRVGPYAAEPLDRPARERAIAMLVRGGHDPGLARRIAMSEPGEIPET
ncbi:RecX family transcriptional regulator [Sphingomonas sp. AP4-R1]|uniref:regulatory protein RecX n=1 Tax=Sphingomonas sp. AP4-R1 TaxID=2735134 RepID=UPI0014934E82|nr:RecX family transcriptional regulator [Sphingomonas sp. AP4-R1]QJU57942.1 RecX family transcriptional regulator [Sphingomonas sp. AP4-R1]